MKIRIATESDFVALKRLFLLLDGIAVQYQPNSFIRVERTDESLLEATKDSDHDILVVETDNEVVGFVFLGVAETPPFPNHKKRRVAYIIDIVVADAHRGKGLGTELIRAARGWGKDHGAEAMRLSVFPENLRAIQLYVENGFIEVMKTMECEL